jgi:hypothetical protein
MLTYAFPKGTTYTGSGTVVVELWTAFSDPFFLAWAEYQGSILSSDPLGQWSNLSSPYAPYPPATVGTPVAGGVTGIALGQIHAPPLGIYANTSNPIMLWSGEWSTQDLAPRTVSITTQTDELWIYTTSAHALKVFPVEALSEIHVIPAPASAAAILVFAATMRRRRASHFAS